MLLPSPTPSLSFDWPADEETKEPANQRTGKELGLEVVERRLMDLVPAPAVRLMKSRVKSRPGVDSVQLSTHNHYHPAHRTRDKDNELDDSGCVLTVVVMVVL